MDAFVTRKKRKSSPEAAATSQEAGNDEPTDVKLAMLSSLHPGVDQEMLLDILLAHDGNVAEASQALRTPRWPKKPGTQGTASAQSSLRTFTVGSAASDSFTPSKRVRLLSRKGATLHLYDPVDISEHTPCTIIHNFLPADEANTLLQELLDESKSFEKITFKLFDNVVSSPHTSGFYVGSYKELQEQKHEYVYNGSRMTVSIFSASCYMRHKADRNTGCQNLDAAAGAGQGSSPGSRQQGDTDPHPHPLWREETEIPISRAMDPQRSLCKLLQRAAGECWVGMFLPQNINAILAPLSPLTTC
jgi:hypothetical protein